MLKDHHSKGEILGQVDNTKLLLGIVRFGKKNLQNIQNSY